MDPKSAFSPEVRVLSSLHTKEVLLTGATGVLGARLLKDLLESTDATIHCLVRCVDEEDGYRRLLRFLSVYDPQLKLESRFRNRVIPYPGTITKPNLDLAPEVYDKLAKKIDAVIHVAANTNLLAPFDQLSVTNVEGTRNVIHFTLRTEQKYLCYVSSYTVMGDKAFDPSFVFKESLYDCGQAFHDLPYQRSKFMGEGLVRETPGLRWNIVRPGQIYGDSRYGHYPQGQTSVGGLFYDIFKTAVETGIAPDSAMPYDVTPVDYVSKGLIHLALRRGTFFETYHLTNPDTKRFRDVINILRYLGYDIRLAPMDEYKGLLSSRRIYCEDRRYVSPMTEAFRIWLVKQQLPMHDGAITDSSYTRQILEAQGIRCPKIDIKLIKTYVDSCIMSQYMPAPAQAPTARAGSVH